jgi:hypothetical protein
MSGPEGLSASGAPDTATTREGYEALLEGWESFAHGWLLLDMVLVLGFALALSATIAYHPTTRRRMSSLEHYEQPKAFLLYSMVAAMVALIVKVQPAMAFVIFGIGGLLRFRTLVGDAKDTGRVILVTVVGLCCGLKIFVVAVPATVIGWLLVYSLERQTAGIIRVSGVGEEAIYDAVRAYRALIQRLGCTIIGEQTKFIRREFLFVVQAPPALGRGALTEQLDQLPLGLRGVVELEQL